MLNLLLHRTKHSDWQTTAS